MPPRATPAARLPHAPTTRAVALAALLAAPGAAAAQTASPVVPGVEVLLADSLGVLRGQRVGLITNHTGRDRRGTSTIDLLAGAPGVRLTALFGPEHGLRGIARGGAHIPFTVDSATGIPVHSLYGATRVPTPRMLAEVDVLVYDVQDVGARVYTYVWTMALAAEAAARAGKRFVVLDRPNPIRGDLIEGGVLEPRWRSFVGQYPVALRYGLTPGELLRYLVGSGQVKATVTVIPMRGYRRRMWWDETGLAWVSPSPNIRDPETALLYPGTVFFEAANASEGRGTDAPLKQVGAPWLTDAGVIARELNARGLPGVRFDSVLRTVGAGEEFAGRRIPMVRLTVTDRDALRPVEAATWLARAIQRRHPAEWRWRGSGVEELAGTRAYRAAIATSDPAVAALLARWRRESAAFARAVERYRLYE